MAQHNYMNVNEVFPILDLIYRKINQGKGVSYNFESPLLSDSSEYGGSLDSSQWQVESFEVIRDTGNPVDPNAIKQIIIVYRNGAIDTITLTRGLNPPVDDTVPDAEYINNLMIVQVSIQTELFGRTQEIIANIVKENGYGKFQKVELTYDDSDWEEVESDIDTPDVVGTEDTETYDNPNDFYDGGGADNDYDTEVDEAEDYSDYGYTEDDEIEPPDDGWADGFDPSDPMDIPLEVSVDIDSDYSIDGGGYDSDEDYDTES